MKRSEMFRVLVIIALMVGGCAALDSPDAVAPPADRIGEDKPVWPAGPEPPRIHYVGRITGASDLGVTRSLVRRLGEAFAGASAEQFVRPAGVAAAGELLAVADPGAPALFLLDREAGRFRKITQANGEDLISPVGVAIGEGQAVYLSDSYLRRIYVYDADGRFRAVFGEDTFARPTALAFDRQRRRLYVADTGAHQVVALDDQGKNLFTLGGHGTGDGEFNWPGHICVTPDGSLLVVDSLNFRVQIFDADGTFRSKFGRHGDGSGDFSRPKGIGVDSHGHVYVADNLFDTVQVFSRTGAFLLGFGRQGEGRGEFWLPVGLAVDTHDRIYVADSYNKRLQIFEYVGGE